VPTHRVIVCGEPFSGNRVMRSLLRRLGCEVMILHGIGDLPRFAQKGSRKYERARERLDEWEPTHAVMLVRSAPIHELSIVRNGGDKDHNVLDRDAQLFDVCDAVLTYRIPLKAISYEALVEDPRGHARWLAAWMGIEASVAEGVELDWIHDGNAKYREY